MGRLTNFFFGRTINPALGAVLARGCQLAYGPTGESEPLEEYSDAVDSMCRIEAAAGLQPPFLVTQFGTDGVMICIAGCTSFRQCLEYWRNSGSRDADPLTPGNINAFVRWQYLAMRDRLLEAANVANIGGLRAPSPIVIAGHSFGGAIAALLARDLKRNYLAQKDVTSVYMFGAPKVGNATFNQGLPAQVYNIRADDDPVPLWPGDHFSTVLRVVSGDLAPYQIARESEYAASGSCYALSSMEYARQPPWPGLSIEQHAAIANAYIQTGILPEAHAIENYYLRLTQVAEEWKFLVRRGDVNLREVLSATDSIAAPTQPANVDSSVPNLPSLGSAGVAPLPTVAGATVTRVGSTLSLVGQGASVHDVFRSRRPRVRPGDGRVKLAAKQMKARMDTIWAHDEGVRMGTRRSTQFVMNPTMWTQAHEDAFWLLYTHLVNLVGDV